MSSPGLDFSSLGAKTIMGATGPSTAAPAAGPSGSGLDFSSLGGKTVHGGSPSAAPAASPGPSPAASPQDLANSELAKSGISVGAMPDATPDDLKKGLADKILESPTYQRLNDVAQFYPNTLKGELKAGGKTLLDLDNLIRTGANKLGAHFDQIDESDFGGTKGDLETHGVAENLGGFGEGVLEFVAGEGALNGLSKAAKLKKLAGVASFLEKYPRLSKIVAVGLKNGLISTGLAEIHGHDNPLTEGAVGAGFGAAAEGTSQGVSSLMQKIRPGATNVAGETIPVLASKNDPSAVVKYAEAGGDLGGIANEQQAGSQAATENIARKSTSDAIEKVNQTRGVIPPEGGAAGPPAPPKFEPVDVQKAMSKVSSFADASDQVQEAAKPVFKKLDEVSGGEFETLKGKIKQSLYVVRHPESLSAADAAEARLADLNKQMDALFEKHASEVGKADLDAAKSAWFDSKVLDDIHVAVNRAYNVGDKGIAQKAGIARTINGNQLRNRLNALVEKSGPQVQKVIGKEGIANLYRIADLTSKPEGEKAFSGVLQNVLGHLRRTGRGAVIGGVAGTLVGGHVAAGALAGAAAEDGIRYMLNKAATNPRVGQMIENVVKTGANPKIYGPLIIRAMDEANGKDKQE